MYYIYDIHIYLLLARFIIKLFGEIFRMENFSIIIDR